MSQIARREIQQFVNLSSKFRFEYLHRIIAWLKIVRHRQSALNGQNVSNGLNNERSISTVIIDELCANNRVKHDVNRFAFTFTHIQYFGLFSHGIARNINVLIDGSSGFIRQKIGMSCATDYKEINKLYRLQQR